MDLGSLKSDDSKKSTKRVGRGHGSGYGKTSGRGQKGQKARSSVRVGFQGGQNPLYRRLPHLRGISNKAHNIGIFRTEKTIVNVKELQRFEEHTEVTPELLLQRGIIKKLKDGLKILGDGDLERALTVRAHDFSASARQKIEDAGGTTEVID